MPADLRTDVPTRERIVRAALQIFQTRGYHGAGLSDILDAAHAPKGSLYHHFPGGKEDLAIAALERVSGDLIALIARARARGAGAGDIVRALARAMAPWLAHRKWRERGIVSALADGAAPETPRLREALATAQRAHIDALTAAIGAGAREEARGRAALAFAVLDGALLQARLARDADPLLEAAERVAALLDGDL